MGVFAMTGGASGIGAAIRQGLQQQGHDVIVVDIHDADIVADLASREGRQQAIQALRSKAPAGLDGFVPCAGLGPNVKPHSLIARVNFFAAVELIEGVRDLVALKQGRIVVISSNSASMPGLNEAYIKLLLERDEEGAATLVDTLDGHNAYAGSKCALTRWMRKAAVQYAGEGIRMNAIAPGITRTALTDQVLEDPELGPVMKDFGATVPTGSIAVPQQIAPAALFLLGKDAEFICGSVLFVDGGHDAMLRPDAF